MNMKKKGRKPIVRWLGVGGGACDAGMGANETCGWCAGVGDTPFISHVAIRAPTASNAAAAATPNSTPGFRYHGNGGASVSSVPASAKIGGVSQG